ncbi:hypothetical protein FSP39_003119 [Pinctada imbricata]|uniref:CARD domain-containing protein n=1 Tax=Pinctada imbricata TaxID=66713 RepID=A0AA88XUS6_PINIB|nr:hypothetical protein FSP39_003119 [Pinctada imbricata]
MLWQLVKKWHESFPGRVSARKLRKALRSCNINTEETHMPKNHKKVLTEMTDYLVQNMVDIKTIMSQLISQDVLSDVTKAYVSAPTTRDQRIMRLLEVLSTKEHGLYMIVDVFKKTGNQFLADELMAKGHIRQIGRKLDLDNHHLDEVDGYFESGIPEMFWQLVKRWHAKYPNRVSARRLRTALQSCSIDTEETHMPKKHKDALHKMTQFLVDNIMDINIMMPLLISGNILSDVTVAYVSAPSTLNQKIMRLLEVLSTKEHGLYMICDIFKKTGQGFIADRMIGIFIF